MEHDITQTPLFYKLWTRFEENKKQVFWGAIFVVIAGVVIAFFLWSQGEKETKAGEALSKVVAQGARAESAAAYLQVAAAHAGTPAGGQALLLAAGALFTEGKFADAQTQFQRFTREYSGSPFLSQASLGIAACFAAQGKTEEAAHAYKELIDRNPTANVAPQARFALAGIYETQKKLDQALTLFEEVARGDANGSLGNEAAMRAEEIKMKLPPPAAVPVAAAPAGVAPVTFTNLTTVKKTN